MKVKKGLDVSKRIDEFDIAKGIGILLVIIGHNIPTGDVRSIIYSFHIPLFLFISGALLKQSFVKWNFGRLVRRENNLLVNYLFYSVLFILFDVLVRVIILKQANVHLIIWDIYQSIVFWGINVMWFISSLLLSKLIIRYLIEKIMKRKYQFIILLLFFLIGSIGAQITPNYTKWSGLDLLVYYPWAMLVRLLILTGFVLLGYMVKSWIFNALNKRYTMLLSLLLLCNIAFAKYTGFVDYHFILLGFAPLTILFGITGIIGTLGVSHVLVHVPLLNKELIVWGKQSLFVMVTHEYLMLKNLIGFFLLKLHYLSDHTKLILLIFLIILIERVLIKYLATYFIRLINEIRSINLFRYDKTLENMKNNNILK